MKNTLLTIEPADLETLKCDMRNVNQQLAAIEDRKFKREKNLYLTRQEVCELLHISVSTLHRIVRNNHLVAYKIGRRVLFRQTDIENILIKLNSYGH